MESWPNAQKINLNEFITERRIRRGESRKITNPSGGYPADNRWKSTGWASGDEVAGKGQELFTNQLMNSNLLNLLLGKKENQQNT